METPGAHAPATNDLQPASTREVREYREDFHFWYSRKHSEEMEKIKKKNILTEQLIKQKEIEMEEEKKMKHINRKKHKEAVKEWMSNKTKLKDEKRLGELEKQMKAEEKRNQRNKLSKEVFEEWQKNHPKVKKTSGGIAYYNFRKITYKDSTTRSEPSMINHEIWRNS